MESYQCIVLEDTITDQLAIEMVLGDYPQIHTIFVSNPKDYLKAVSQKTFDLYIVDIMLDSSLTGIDLIQTIDNPNAWVIISSSMDSKDYYEQFKALPFNKFYIKKPIDEFVFKTNLESFIFTQKEKSDKFISIKQGNFVHKINHKDILFIETTDHATTLYTEQKKLAVYQPLKTFEEQLLSFLKINRNTIINPNHIRSVNMKEGYVEILNHKLSISRSLKQAFLEKYAGTLK